MYMLCIALYVLNNIKKPMRVVRFFNVQRVYLTTGEKRIQNQAIEL